MVDRILRQCPVLKHVRCEMPDCDRKVLSNECRFEARVAVDVTVNLQGVEVCGALLSLQVEAALKRELQQKLGDDRNVEIISGRIVCDRKEG